MFNVCGYFTPLLVFFFSPIFISPNKCFLFLGAMNPLAEEHLSKQDLLSLDMLKFLCMCVTTAQTNTVSFRAADIRRELLMLIDSSMLDPTRSLHLHMVSSVKEVL